MSDTQELLSNLTHNPFAEPGDAFFQGAERQQRLDKLRQLSQWPHPVVAVTGPRGSGKTVLFRQMSGGLQPSAKAARINGGLVNQSRELLSAMAHGFGVSVPSEAERGTLRKTLGEFLKEQKKGKRSCVVMVDDAHLLEPASVDELMALAAKSDLRVALFAEERLLKVLEKAADKEKVVWQEARLAGFSADEVRAYLEWRLAQANYLDKLPFSEHQVSKIAEHSEGMPGSVDNIANNLLKQLQEGVAVRGRFDFPVSHGILVVMLVAALGVLYLLVGAPAGQDEPIVVASTDDPPVIEEPSEETPGAVVPTPDIQPRVAVRPADDAQPGDVSDSNPVLKISTQPSIPPAEPGGSAAPTETAPEVPAQETPLVASAADVADSGPAGDNREPDTADVAAWKQPNGTANAESVAANAPEPVVAEDTPPATASQTSQQSEVVGRGTPISERDGDWLLRQSPGNYTLQLVTVSAPERVQAYLDKQGTDEPFAHYELYRDGRSLYAIVYGVFDSRTDAEQAAERLPQSVGADIKPWIRPLAQIHDAIATTR